MYTALMRCLYSCQRLAFFYRRRLKKPTFSLVHLMLIVGLAPSWQLAPLQAQTPIPVSLSQVYGGGGNTGAPWNADFIELFNASPAPVTLNGWSVQYAAKTGTTWQVTPLDNLTIPGFGYLLIQEAGGATGNPLPTPDASGNLKLAATDGKVALVSSQTPISGQGDAAVVDFVGYGAASEAEGSPTGKLANATAAMRKSNGCIDTNNNANDFDVVTPAPRNSASAPSPCTLLVTDTPTSTPLPTDTPTLTITNTVVVDTPTASATSIVTDTPTFTPVATDTPVISDTATVLPVDTATPTATSAPARLLISEFLADPQAVSDTNGEWVELYNPTGEAVNLLGWTLRDLGRDKHTIATDLIIQPGQYLVLARNSDPSLNGGVTVNYVYTSLTLANASDDLLLIAPDGAEVDRVSWGGTTGVNITPGASLERTSTDPTASWATAQAAWIGSAGDKGSPGIGYSPPIATDTPTPTLTPIAADTPTPDPGATATPTVTVPVGLPTHLLISEFLADPQAVSDANGEWIEIYNAGSAAVNLRGWTIADLRTDHHTINADLILQPGTYLVLARNSDSATNGGAPVAYVYTGVTLANSADEIVLLDPNQAMVDQVAWGGTTNLKITPGASLERSNLDDPASWVTAATPWSGSAGDKGSPGSTYIAPPATPTPEATISATPVLTNTPTSAVTPGPPAAILISEFLADPKAVSDANGEWIELYNAGREPVNLRGWSLADLRTDHHIINADLIVQPGAYVVLAHNSDSASNGGVVVDYVYTGLTLANSADEILLLDPNQTTADQVAWGGTMDLKITPGASLERTSLDNAADWATATTPWPDSAGDKGSPGSAYTAPATPVATGTPTLATTPGPAPAILISEFLADPKAVSDTHGEWIELYNPTGEAVNLRGWALADLGGEHHVIDADLLIPPAGYVVLGRSNDLTINGGAPVNYVYAGISLANSADEILLLTPNGELADQVAWGGDSSLDPAPGISYERTDFSDPNAWALAQSAWPGSAGDLGTPGAVASPPLATPTSTPGDQVTGTPGPLPRILISEFLADPQAVDDRDGEWIELYNASDTPVNLRGWVLADQGRERHIIASDLIIQPGQYLVLGRNSDPAGNGGAPVSYVYSGFSLANRQDAILLLAPSGEQVDAVTWGGDSGLTIKAGVSYERSDLDELTSWELTQSTWPGSLGDFGTPGGAPDEAPVITTPTVQPTGEATSAWVPVTTPGPLLIEEVAYRGNDEEFIALLNLGATAVDLTGWAVGDAESPGKSEGIYALPSGYSLAPGEIFVLARNGLAFRNQWGRPANGEVEATDPDTLDLMPRKDLAKGALALNDSGDEVVLLDPNGALADAVAFTNGNYAVLHLTGELRPPREDSLQWVPPGRFPLVSDIRQRFLAAPPRPFEGRGLPLAQVQAPISLPAGLLAAWGSLGGYSNFSSGYTAPPHYVLAAAGAQGLDFVALADPMLAPLLVDPTPVIRVEAWGWQDAAAKQAVIYREDTQALDNPTALVDYLSATGTLAQWQSKHPPASPALTSFAADSATAPGNLAAIYQPWLETGLPFLPAGNANPDLPGAVTAAPRYTGLAVSQRDEPGLLAALTAHRGWLTSAPGLWLTLYAEQLNGESAWMGSVIEPSNLVLLQINYGDRTSQVAGLTIWQDDRPIRQLDLPSTDGHWSVQLPAAPGSFLYAVATQADGDFAVTAPLYVLPSSDGQVLINEVLPAPAADHNKDGVIDGNDEFIELYNPGTQPVALSGWQLSDNTGDADVNRRFTFGTGRYLSGGSWLALWRKETRINQNVENDYIRLLKPDGTEIDRVDWQTSPTKGQSFSRLPDGKAWSGGAKITPGRHNLRLGEADNGEGGSNLPPPSPHHEEQVPPSTLGQAGGPPNSIAQSKLAGLTAWVEFHAVVTAPPGLFKGNIYVADPAPGLDGPLAGIGVNIFLRSGDFPALQEGDRIRVRGVLQSFRGELELDVESVEQIWRVGSGTPLQPLPITVVQIGESLEGRLVSFQGVVSSWQGDSIFLADPDNPTAEPVRVTVRSSLPWKRPYVKKGERWQVTGIVSQFAKEPPWNGGYRILVRYQKDLVKIAP